MANRPNIIFYFTDQQRADTCGCYGQKLDITPRLDQLASEGVKFEWAFSPQPVCGPCRALFQTGKYPTETGCFRNNVMLPANVKTLGSYIEEAGYETAYIGKWHLASDGELEKKPTIDHTITAIPKELRGGYAGFWYDGEDAELMTIGVGKAYQRQGIAAALLQVLVDEAKRQGASRMLLEVRVDNDPALALYQRFGFERMGLRKRYYQPEGIDAYTMSLDLEPRIVGFAAAEQ